MKIGNTKIHNVILISKKHVKQKEMFKEQYILSSQL